MTDCASLLSAKPPCGTEHMIPVQFDSITARSCCGFIINIDASKRDVPVCRCSWRQVEIHILFEHDDLTHSYA